MGSTCDINKITIKKLNHRKKKITTNFCVIFTRILPSLYSNGSKLYTLNIKYETLVFIEL